MMRAALFIDAANVFYSEKTMGWKIDFAKVYEYFNKHFALYNAFYYSAEPQEGEDEKQKEYRDYSLMGYTMRLKQLKEIYDSRGKLALKKANLDIEMVVDMFATQQNYDIAVLFTGDSDFTRAVELLRMNGKQIFVLSTKGHSGLELINASDKFMDFQDLKKTFEKKEVKKNSTKTDAVKKKEKKVNKESKVNKVSKSQEKPKKSYKNQKINIVKKLEKLEKLEKQSEKQKPLAKQLVKKNLVTKKLQQKKSSVQKKNKKLSKKPTDEKNVMPSDAVIKKAMQAIENKNKKIKN